METLKPARIAIKIEMPLDNGHPAELNSLIQAIVFLFSPVPGLAVRQSSLPLKVVPIPSGFLATLDVIHRDIGLKAAELVIGRLVGHKYEIAWYDEAEMIWRHYSGTRRDGIGRDMKEKPLIALT
jgi:hypothetical protein